jgi:hypothetical protein
MKPPRERKTQVLRRWLPEPADRRPALTDGADGRRQEIGDQEQDWILLRASPFPSPVTKQRHAAPNIADTR